MRVAAEEVDSDVWDLADDPIEGRHFDDVTGSGLKGAAGMNDTGIVHDSEESSSCVCI